MWGTMTDKKIELPMIFEYLLTATIFAMFVSVFFDISFCAIIVFFMLLVALCFTVLDRKYGEILCDHKITYFLLNINILLALISLIGFNYNEYSLTMNLLVIINIVAVVVLVILDMLFTSDNFFDKFWCNIINIIKVCLFACILAYYYGVTSTIYIFLTVVFELINIGVKIYSTIHQENAKKKAVDSSDLKKNVVDTDTQKANSEADLNENSENSSDNNENALNNNENTLNNNENNSNGENVNNSINDEISVGEVENIIFRDDE